MVPLCCCPTAPCPTMVPLCCCPTAPCPTMVPLRHGGSRGAVQMVVHDAGILCGCPSAGTRASSARALCRELLLQFGTLLLFCKDHQCIEDPPTISWAASHKYRARSHWLSLALAGSDTHPDSLHDSHSNSRSSCTLTVARTLSHSGSLSRSLALIKLLSGESVAPGRSP